MQWLLFLISCTMVLVSTVSSAACPAKHYACYCRNKYTYLKYIYCEQLGLQLKVPSFTASTDWFEELHFRYGTTILCVQDNAFAGLKLLSLNLQDVGCIKVERHAFNGLQTSLMELYLDGNLLTKVPGEAIQGLKNLRFLGLHNNQLLEIPIILEELPLLEYLYLFNNNIRRMYPGIFTVFPALKGLLLSNNHIDTLLDGVFNNLTELLDLEMTNNSISDMPGSVFQSLVSLKKLKLDYNQIEVIPEEIFQRLLRLTFLDLSHNYIGELHPSTFTFNTELTYLDLSYNSIKRIRKSLLATLTQLVELNLQQNDIQSIDAGAFINLNSLLYLDLSENQLDSFSGLFHENMQLFSLNFAGNRIRTLAEDDFLNTTDIQVLNLARNSISDIRNSFLGLSELSLLYLEYNQLKDVKYEWFSNLTNLEVLNLDHNMIKTLQPGWADDLSSLRFVALDYNELVDLPRFAFRGAANLRTLVLSHNKIATMQELSFNTLGSLHFLYLDNNALAEIPAYSLNFLSNLVKLDLRHNDLIPIYKGSFVGIEQLRELDLDYNRIAYVSETTFGNLVKLRILSIRGNRLYGDMDIFREQKYMEDFDLSENEMTGLPMKSIRKMPNLRKLSIHKNPLHCTMCAQPDWLRSLNESILVNPNEILCDYPRSVRGTKAMCWGIVDGKDSCRSNQSIKPRIRDECGITTLAPSVEETTTTPDEILPLRTTRAQVSLSTTARKPTLSSTVKNPQITSSNTKPMKSHGNHGSGEIEIAETSGSGSGSGDGEVPYFESGRYSEFISDDAPLVDSGQTFDGIDIGNPKSRSTEHRLASAGSKPAVKESADLREKVPTVPQTGSENAGSSTTPSLESSLEEEGLLPYTTPKPNMNRRSRMTTHSVILSSLKSILTSPSGTGTTEQRKR